MPQVNGNHYRTFGMGYSAEKAKSQPPEMGEAPSDEAHSESDGAEMHIKSMPDGSFETKSKRKGEKHDVHSAQPEKHESEEELKEHVGSHFGGDSHEPEEHQGDGDEEEGGNALKSILE